MEENQDHIENFKIESAVYPIWDKELRDEVHQKYSTKEDLNNAVDQLNNLIETNDSTQSNNLNNNFKDLSLKTQNLDERLTDIENKKQTVLQILNKDGNIWTIGEVDING